MTTQTRSENRNDMAEIGEQFRKTTEAAAEQTRQTLGSAQEKVQENLARTQQAQSEWARMMFRVSEQNSQLGTAALTSFWDASLSALKFATLGQSQAERTILQVVEQNRQARDEGIALLNETFDRIRHDQAELYRLTQENLRLGLFYAGKTGRREGEPAT